MDDKVELVYDDGEGLAVSGERTAVEKFLRHYELWEVSETLNLERLRAVLALGGEATQVASEVAAESSRWVKLTKDSARRMQQDGLMKSKTPGEPHLMLGVPGKVTSWLQAETGPTSWLTNPAVMSGVAGLMSQIAAEQAMAEITAYLAAIDEKIVAVLRKQDNAVLADMHGVGYALDRAITIREEGGEVDDDVWSTVDQSTTVIGATQGYALLELDAIAESLESAKMGDLATKAEAAEPDVQKWLVVLARCFQLQEAVDVLELERRTGQSPELLDAHRRAMWRHRQQRREAVVSHTEDLLARMDAAIERANGKLFWTRAKSMAVVQSGNHVASDVHRFHELLGIEDDPRTWNVKELGRVAKVGSQTIQQTKDKGPTVLKVAGTVAGAIASVAALKALFPGDAEDDEDVKDE